MIFTDGITKEEGLSVSFYNPPISFHSFWTKAEKKDQSTCKQIYAYLICDSLSHIHSSEILSNTSANADV